ncbi:acetyl-CoA synthetase-like protein [Hysterangium stoloniferum]|nr:acetyl-CoA synthetase-like protein [Hysterangium stoloniferum]
MVRIATCPGNLGSLGVRKRCSAKIRQSVRGDYRRRLGFRSLCNRQEAPGHKETITYQSHISLLESVAASFPSCNALKVPIYDEYGETRGWNDVTYQQFYSDVERMAAHWIETLELPRNSVVAVWLYGISYPDVITLFSISRACYVPQVIRSTLESPILVSEMLAETNAKALIYDASSGVSPAHFRVPVHFAVDIKSLTDIPNVGILPPLTNIGNAHQTMIFYYTSGSTSGRPKLVPLSRRWLHALIMKSKLQAVFPASIVTTRIGSFSHAGQLFQFIGLFPCAGCMALVRPDFSSTSLIQMVEECKLTTISIYSFQLIKHLKNACSDLRLLHVLQSVSAIVCTAGPMPESDLDWACSNGLHIVMVFGATETGLLLSTTNVRGEKPAAYKSLDLEGFNHTFVPVGGSSPLTGGNLLELVVLSESQDCPDVSFRSADGHFHTGDIFIEVSPKRYISWGRLDDRIKMYDGLICEARVIEDHTKTQCSDVIADCIVVGAGRFSPTLIVEANSRNPDQTKIKAEVAIRIAAFNERLYQHERIKSTHILVVEIGTLPRTVSSGLSIRRSLVEDQFKAQLDGLDKLNSK